MWTANEKSNWNAMQRCLMRSHLIFSCLPTKSWNFSANQLRPISSERCNCWFITTLIHHKSLFWQLSVLLIIGQVIRPQVISSSKFDPLVGAQLMERARAIQWHATISPPLRTRILRKSEWRASENYERETFWVLKNSFRCPSFLLGSFVERLLLLP